MFPQEVSGDDNAATTLEKRWLPSLKIERTRTGLPGYMYSFRNVVIEMSLSGESTGKSQATLEEISLLLLGILVTNP